MWESIVAQSKRLAGFDGYTLGKSWDTVLKFFDMFHFPSKAGFAGALV